MNDNLNNNLIERILSSIKNRITNIYLNQYVHKNFNLKKKKNNFNKNWMQFNLLIFFF